MIVSQQIKDSKEENTATSLFLEKMEAARLRRECQQLIDMRGKVPGVCQKYAFKGRDFYLDDVSYQLFQQGLADNRGVFTVGMYEAIVNGHHTLKAIRKASELQSETMGDDKGANHQSITVIDFGYYRRRNENRLEYVTDVILEYAGVRYPAKTRNMSANGLQLHLTNVPGFVELEPAYISFTDIGGAPGQMERILFTLMKIEVITGALHLSLRRERSDDDDDVGEVIRQFIEQRKAKYKHNIEDESEFVEAMLFRRMYAESSSQIPTFICKGSDGWRAAIIASNRNNLPVFDLFEHGVGRYDMTPITLPHRAQLLGKMAQGEVAGNVALLATYRPVPREQGGQVHSFFNLEMASLGQFIDMLRHACQLPEFRVYKIEVKPIQIPDQRKLDMFLAVLKQQSEEEARDLQSFVGTFRAMATLSDVTSAVTATWLARATTVSDGGVGEEASMVWVGAEMVPMLGGKTVRRMPAGEWSYYTHMPFGFHGRRVEDRYSFVSELECQWEGNVYAAKTVDISVHGAMIMFEQATRMVPGDEVLVSFAELQQHVPDVKLKKIPYRIKTVSTSGLEMGLERQVVKSREITEFFASMISRNISRLKRDVGDVRAESSARMYECMFAEHNTVIPFFISKTENGVVVIDKIAVIDDESRLARFFHNSEGRYDFSALTEARRMARVVDALTYVRRQPDEARYSKARQMLLYLYRDQPVTTPGSRIVVLSDDELTGVLDKKAFIRQLTLKPEFLVVNLTITPIRMIADRDLDKLFSPVMQAARHRALKKREELKAILGVGELQDITDLYLQ